MKTYAIVAALSALAFAGNSYADGASYDYPQASTSAKTRAEVKAETLAAIAHGQLQYGEADWPQVAFVSTKSRAEVTAETLTAIANGELRWLNREGQGSVGSYTPKQVQPAAVITAGVRQ